MPDRMTQAAERLKVASESWMSVEVDALTEQVIPDSIVPADQSRIQRIEARYVETAAGQRMLDDRTHETDGKTGRSTSYCDGDR
ncbi:hypothetical protein EP7_002593 [Isosphaeraceae bacterium EP7]